ncbi:hypothetical protein PHYPSEUDO_000750 [Phytophthora pseudosyringae]|uniref:EF-hand domain-containing protein n=1 Tax=Phytophthora pseudosyringae TaxID=221518 RepID=A0A8T1WE02_9STRA|nr:hypothetical protein PHYPSEUDO_000750 [Phytophthora pseudosyringae]
MDSRVSTAPNPKSKKWLPTHIEASCLLRQPSGKSTNLDVPVVVDRPKTCPSAALKPQLHWNLNNAALRALSRSQKEQLYGLFQFYDSSSIGDSLPSINCARLLEILRDAGLLSERELSVVSVEKVFAQATMGKMRVYLDADGQPALTFSLFCGVLLNCAMLVTPSARPATALEQILPILLEGSRVDRSYASAAKGLLRHVPADESTSLWTPEQSQVPQTEDTVQDFRDLPMFQQVIAECARDRDLEALKQEKMARRYEIPDRLLASFHPDTLTLILSKFRLFDANDRGAVPRQEIFALLSCLGTHVDLPDPYAVLAKLPSFNNFHSLPRPESGNNGDPSTNGEITLTELLQVIEVAREAKRHSATANLASVKIRMDRAATVAKGTIVPTTPSHEPIPSCGSNDDRIGSAQNDPGRKKSGNNSNNSASFRDRGRRHGVVALKSRKSIVSSTAEVNSSIQALPSTKQGSSKAHVTHHGSVSSRKKSMARRRKSSTINAKTDATIIETADPRDLQGSEDRISTLQSLCDNSTGVASTRNTSAKSSSDSNVQTPKANQNLADEDNQNVQLLYVPSTIIVQVHDPLSASNSKAIRIFLLLGGEHDGAIYCTLSLVFATKEIMESEGIYYTTATSETTRTKPVLPTQHTLTNALLMMKKCVLAKLEQGFEQRPAGQLDAVTEMLQNLREREPNFRSPVTKTSRNTNIAPVSASASPGRRRTGRFISSAASDRGIRLQQKLPPHSSPGPDVPNNYKDLFTTWGVSQHDNFAWVHDVNAASPLKPALPTPKSYRSGQLSPLRLPFR